MLSLVTSSPDEQFCTTQAVKDLIGSTGTADDALLNSIITRASRWAESYVGYPLAAAAYRETLSGYGGRRLMVSRRPVVSVTGLWDTTDTGAATTMLSSEFKVDRKRGFLERNAGFAWDAPAVAAPFAFPLGAAYMPGEESAPWLVDYVAGYSHAGLTSGDSGVWSTAGPGGTTSTERTLPEDIEDAVIYRVIQEYKGKGGAPVVERAVKDLRVKFGTFDDGTPVDPAKTLLDPYRAVV